MTRDKPLLSKLLGLLSDKVKDLRPQRLWSQAQRGQTHQQSQQKAEIWGSEARACPVSGKNQSSPFEKGK